MIDDKKIEEAARYYCNNRYPASQDAPFIAEGFRHGAKWAINEFLKDLWYPASEEPKKVKNLILETTYEYGKPIYHLIKYMPNGNNVCAWREWYKGAHISRWLYIDDLLPKEGGEQ
jgi:hypothetical protein